MPRRADPDPEGLPVLLTRAQALAAGLTRSAISHRVAQGRWLSVRHGAYLRVDLVDGEEGFDAQRTSHVHHAIASALVNPGAVIACGTAALMHGAPLVSGIPLQPQLVVRSRHGSTRSGTKFREFALADQDIDHVGVPITTPLRTWADVARTGRVPDAVAVGDHFVHMGLLSTQQLLTHAAGARGRNCRVMRRAAALVDGRRESPLESWSAVKFDDWQLPPPSWQAEIRDESDRFVGRVDALWIDEQVVGEADGAMKYTDRTALVAEKVREDRLRALGFTVIRWTWRDLAQSPWLIQSRLTTALTGSTRHPRW